MRGHLATANPTCGVHWYTESGSCSKSGVYTDRHEIDRFYCICNLQILLFLPLYLLPDNQRAKPNWPAISQSESAMDTHIADERLEELDVKDMKVTANDRQTDLYEIDPQAEKKLLRKIDLHVVPILWLLFLLAFLDRTNIGTSIPKPDQQP